MLGKLKQRFVSWLLKGVHLDEIHIGERSVVISGTGANMDGQKVENVGAPDSDDDAPRRDTIDAKITTHKADAAAHHVKTTLDYPMKQKPTFVVRWVIPGWYAKGYSDFAVVADRIYYTPIFVEETTTYIRIGLEVTVAVAGEVDLRIFNWGDGLPSSLILSAGTVDTGTIGKKEIIISQQLTRGYYFLAGRPTSNPTLRGLDSAAAMKPPVAGFSSAGGNAPSFVILRVDAVYADPAPAPATTSFMNRAFVRLREF